MAPNCFSVHIFSRLYQIWHSNWANTWAIARDWPRGLVDPLSYNIATNQAPNGWKVTANFDTVPPEVLIKYPHDAERSSQYTVFLAGSCSEQMGNASFLLPPLPFCISHAQIAGDEVIQGLPPKGAAEITVSHPEPAFSLCEYPECHAPKGVRVSVLACGLNGDKTNQQQFVLFVENFYYFGLANETPAITIHWTRRGILE